MSKSTDPAKPITEAKAAVLASLHAVGASTDTELKSRATDLHANSGVIAEQEKELMKQTTALAKQSEQWQKIADTGTKKLNEFGDIQNWAEMIERDLLVVEETLNLAKRNQSDQGTRDSRGR